MLFNLLPLVDSELKTKIQKRHFANKIKTHTHESPNKKKMNAHKTISRHLGEKKTQLKAICCTESIFSLYFSISVNN